MSISVKKMYDQEKPQSQTVDKPTASRARATEH